MLKPEYFMQIRSIHYNDVIMSEIASQITSVSIVYSTICSGADKRKHQTSASLALCAGNSPVNSPHKGPVTRKIFPADDVIMTMATDVPASCVAIPSAAMIMWILLSSSVKFFFSVSRNDLKWKHNFAVLQKFMIKYPPPPPPHTHTCIHPHPLYICMCIYIYIYTYAVLKCVFIGLGYG